MTVPERIIRELPKSFTRQDVLKMMTKRGYSVSYSNNILEQLVISDKAIRIKRGSYRKNTN